MAEFSHKSVLLNESVDALNIKPDGIYVDLTVGGGGHSFEIAKRLSRKGRLFCFDRDSEAIRAAGERLKEFKNVEFIHSRFSEIKSRLKDYDIEKVDGILLDIGVSSHQIDTVSRGFSYKVNAPLDMRMSGEGKSAQDVVNGYSEKELADIIFKYGEEKFAKQIAREIVKSRPLRTTDELTECIKRGYPAKFMRDKHPSKQTFQAIRIEVNEEFYELEKAIEDGFEMLNANGVLAIISFHSLEDRIVKQKFLSYTKGCTCPPDFPVCVCGKTPDGFIPEKRGIIPSEEEINENRRSKSARLRRIIKIGKEK